MGELFRAEVEEAGTPGIGCHWIGRNRDAICRVDQRQRTPCRPTAGENPGGVDDREGGAKGRAELGADLGDSLVEVWPSADHRTEPVLHSQRRVRQGVVLDYRYVDHAVRLDNRFQDLPRSENGAPEIEFHRSGVALVGGRSACVTGSFFNSRTCEGAAGVVARVVENGHRRSASREALTDQLADQLGVRVGGLLGCAIPRAVGLDGDPLAGFHECFDAAQSGK